jgi:hypothetical protein
MGLTDNLKFYFDLNQAAGGRVDATRKVAGVTEVGTLVTATGGVPGGGLSADFNAAGNINAPDAANLLFGERWSISLWMKIDAATTGTNYGIVTKRTNTSAGSEFAIINNGGAFAVFLINAANSSLVINSSGFSVSNTAWQHYVVRFNRNTGTNSVGCLRVVRNGELGTMYTANLSVANRPPVPSVNATPANKPLLIGANAITTERLDGQMVKVGAWDQEITDAEVVQLYNNGSGLLFSQLGGGLSVRGRERNSRAR